MPKISATEVHLARQVTFGLADLLLRSRIGAIASGRYDGGERHP